MRTVGFQRHRRRPGQDGVGLLMATAAAGGGKEKMEAVVGSMVSSELPSQRGGGHQWCVRRRKKVRREKTGCWKNLKYASVSIEISFFYSPRF